LEKLEFVSGVVIHLSELLETIILRRVEDRGEERDIGSEEET
jgi:hypothetical protein